MGTTGQSTQFRVAVTLLVGALLVATAPTVPVANADAKLSASKLKSIAKKFHTYLRIDDEAVRKKAWAKAKKHSDKLTFKQLETVLPGQRRKAGYEHGITFRAQGEEWSYSVYFPRGAKKGLLPLVVDPGHASITDSKGIEGAMGNWMRAAGCTEEVIYVRTNIIDKLSHEREKRYDQWVKNPRPSGSANTETIARLLLATIAHAAKRYPVDPHRIYVEGLSQTGFWVWILGAYAPGRFAAIAPMSSVTWQVQTRLENLRNLPTFIIHGTEDKTCPFRQAKQAADRLKELEFSVDFEVVDGGGHVERTFARWRQVWPRVAKMTRKPYPKEVSGVVLGPTRLHWLEVAKIAATDFSVRDAPCHVSAKIEAQTIDVEVKGCKKLLIWLSTELINLDEKVIVRINGKKVFDKLPKVRVRAVLERAAQEGDGGAVYSSVLEIGIP